MGGYRRSRSADSRTGTACIKKDRRCGRRWEIMNILVINCGSSSLKFQLIEAESEKMIAKGICERIGIEGSQICYTPAGGEKESDRLFIR